MTQLRNYANFASIYITCLFKNSPESNFDDHPGMPLLLDDGCLQAWLDPELQDKDFIRELQSVFPKGTKAPLSFLFYLL
jgi:hypothetical protein